MQRKTNLMSRGHECTVSLLDITTSMVRGLYPVNKFLMMLSLWVKLTPSDYTWLEPLALKSLLKYEHEENDNG